jgi:hypothetical protein
MPIAVAHRFRESFAGVLLLFATSLIASCGGPDSTAPVTLTSISVTTPPTKMNYTVGESFSATGMVVTGRYSDSTTAPVTVTTAMLSYDFSTAGSKTVTITYDGKTATVSGVMVTTIKSDEAPVFTLQPQSVTVMAGSRVTFTVAASGTPAPTYQWQIASDLAPEWYSLPDGKGPSYSDLAGTDAGFFASHFRYRAVASNSAGTAFSQVAMIDGLCATVAFSDVTPNPNTMKGLDGNTNTWCPTAPSVDSVKSSTYVDIRIGPVSNVVPYVTMRYFLPSSGIPGVGSVSYSHPTAAPSGGPGPTANFQCDGALPQFGPCSGVAVDLVNRTITFTDAVLKAGVGALGIVTINGMFRYP